MYVCVCVGVGACMHACVYSVCAGALRVQNMGSEPLEMEPQAAVSYLIWVLTMEPWSSTKPGITLNHWENSSAPTFLPPCCHVLYHMVHPNCLHQTELEHGALNPSYDILSPASLIDLWHTKASQSVIDLWRAFPDLVSKTSLISFQSSRLRVLSW